jgi:hypothetical protein
MTGEMTTTGSLLTSSSDMPCEFNLNSEFPEMYEARHSVSAAEMQHYATIQKRFMQNILEDM